LSAAALPTLDIAEGALDKIFAIYKQLLPAMGGYLTEAGQLNRRRLQMLLDRLSHLEQETLELRAQVCAPRWGTALHSNTCWQHTKAARSGCTCPAVTPKAAGVTLSSKPAKHLAPAASLHSSPGSIPACVAQDAEYFESKKSRRGGRGGNGGASLGHSSAGGGRAPAQQRQPTNELDADDDAAITDADITALGGTLIGTAFCAAGLSTLLQPHM
jgi:Xrn1 helical domain